MKHSTPEEDRELANLLSPKEPEPLVVSLDTSTPQGMAWRKHRLQIESQENYIANMARKYRETGNKSYLIAIDNITNQGDNLPTQEL